MQGRLFSLFEQGFPSYFVLLMVGFLFATSMGALCARRLRQNPDVIVDLGLMCLISGVAGSRVLHVLADGYFWDYVHLCTDPSLVSWPITRAECLSPLYAGEWDKAAAVCHPVQTDCFAWAKFWNGGFTFYGGFLGAMFGAAYLFRTDRFPLYKGLDMGGMMLPIGLGFGRLGCLLAGCCFGVTTNSPFGLSFPANSPASEWQFRHDLLGSAFMDSLAVHATQIYESGLAFAIAAVLILFGSERKRYDGHVFVMFMVLYAFGRFGLEMLRSDDRGGVLGLSTSQWFSVIMLFLAVAFHRHAAGRAKSRLTAA